MSALFGHVKGAFTGAAAGAGRLPARRPTAARCSSTSWASSTLGEQALLLHALEGKRWRPVGADAEVGQRLRADRRHQPRPHRRGRRRRFRADLLARLDLWTFRLPGLAERRADLAPNLDHELERATAAIGRRITLAADARARFLAFAESPTATWPGNFRDLAGAVHRMATLAPGGHVDVATVDREVARLTRAWHGVTAADRVTRALGDRAATLDRFDRAQLEDVLAVCAHAPSLSDAGRQLFAASRARRTTTNDADRLRKYLARFELTWDQARGAAPPSPPR
jgi:transcriptional regulatory protein RtcR